MQFDNNGRQRRKPRGRKVPTESDRKYETITAEENDAVINIDANRIVAESLARIALAAEYQRNP